MPDRRLVDIRSLKWACSAAPSSRHHHRDAAELRWYGGPDEFTRRFPGLRRSVLLQLLHAHESTTSMSWGRTSWTRATHPPMTLSPGQRPRRHCVGDRVPRGPCALAQAQGAGSRYTGRGRPATTRLVRTGISSTTRFGASAWEASPAATRTVPPNDTTTTTGRGTSASTSVSPPREGGCPRGAWHPRGLLSNCPPPQQARGGLESNRPPQKVGGIRPPQHDSSCWATHVKELRQVLRSNRIRRCTQTNEAADTSRGRPV